MKDNKELTKIGRCDRCGAKAKVMTFKKELELFLCGHHIKTHSEKLQEQQWKIYKIGEANEYIKEDTNNW